MGRNEQEQVTVAVIRGVSHAKAVAEPTANAGYGIKAKIRKSPGVLILSLVSL